MGTCDLGHTAKPSMLFKNLEYIFFHLTFLIVRGSFAYTWYYKTIVHSLLPFPPPNPELADFFFYIQQLNISHRVVVGKMKIYEPTGPLKVTLDEQRWTEDGFKELSSQEVELPGCMLIILREVLKSFKPSGAFNEKNCSLNQGDYELEALDFDQVMHTQYEKIQLGRIIFTIKFGRQDGKILFGIIVDLESQNLQFYEFQMGRGEEYMKRIEKYQKKKENKNN